MQSHFLKYKRQLPENPNDPLADLIMEASEFNKFTPTLFGLNSIHIGRQPKQVIAAVFDLEGFTDFCSTNDAHLIVPEFTGLFINWLFDQIRLESIDYTKENEDNESVYLSTGLPFYAKFLGDGFLFLWEVDHDGAFEFCEQHKCSHQAEIQGDIGCLISILRDICNNYSTDLYPKSLRSFMDPPTKLRCGIAQGSVSDLGNGKEYVGPCINMASRLQKAAGLGIAVLKKGINLDRSASSDLETKMIKKIYNIRGHGNEIIYIFRADYRKLTEEGKKYLQDVKPDADGDF